MRIVALGDRDPQFLTHREVDATLPLLDAAWTATDSAEARDLADADGVWLLPGTPYRDDAAAYAAVAHCLTTGTPFLGTCGGFQYACVELARRGGVTRAAHADSAPDAEELVVAPLACSLYGEEREVRPVGGTRLAEICGDDPFPGFHFCGLGLADAYVETIERAGAVVCAVGDDSPVEAIELPGHPFFLGTAFQPQVGVSESGRLPPLLEAFLDAARARRRLSGGGAPRRRSSR
jgi:CTP synthase (UTP-ammonia lyase)